MGKLFVTIDSKVLWWPAGCTDYADPEWLVSLRQYRRRNQLAIQSLELSLV